MSEKGKARIGAYKVAVHDPISERANGVDNKGSDGDVGDKAAIHDVDVHELGTSAVDCLHLLT
jgi:hypothetical protein